MNKSIISLILAFVLLFSTTISAQNQKFNKEQVLAMTEEELGELSLEDLMSAVETLGLSSVDELFSMIMNKSLSSASKSEETSFTAPLASTMITKDEILQWGCNSIEEALRLIPGVFVATKTNGNFDVHLRGLNNITEGQRLLYTENQNTKLMIDGRDVTDYISGSMFMDFLPIGIEDIKSIEVVRGPSSALYGQNAVTGVINIITEKPGDKPEYMTNGMIQTSQDLGTTIASAATRLKLNQHLAIGVSVDLESRKRTTEQVYIPVGNNQFVYSDNYDDPSTVTDFQGGWIDIQKIANLKTRNNKGVYLPAVFEHLNIEELLTEPTIAKRQQALNGYVALNFNKTNINISGGYNKTLANTSTLDESIFSLGGRTNQGGYINVNGNVGDFALTMNYDKHSNTYCTGAPGFSVDVIRTGAVIDYTFNLFDDKWMIRPIFEYRGYRAIDKRDTYTKNIKGTEYIYSSFFGKPVETYTYSPSIMSSLKPADGWKITGAARLDITTNPSRENMNYTLSLNRNFNNKHFIRLGYGKASRAAVLTNTSVDYLIDHRSIGLPNFVNLKGSTHNLMHIHSYEIGYRSRPLANILVDFEGFYSISEDYGALKSSKSYVTTTGTDFMGWIGNCFTDVLNGKSPADFMSNNWDEYYSTHSIFEFDNVPFKVRQLGFSVNMDYIVNKYLIFKSNLNWQQTYIDNYYQYSQKGNIANQIAACINREVNEFGINQSVIGFSSDIIDGAIQYAKQSGGINPEAIYDYSLHCATARQGIKSEWSDLTMEDVLALRNAFINNEEYIAPNGKTVPRDDMLGLYYGIMYGIDIIPEKSEFILADAAQVEQKKNDNHKHSATPSFYGSIGFICKPMEIVNFSALMSFMSKREFNTSYGSTTMPAMCNLNIKLGWTPNKNVEFFIQGHNILSNSKQEFAYGDPVKTEFTTGLICKF